MKNQSHIVTILTPSNHTMLNQVKFVEDIFHKVQGTKQEKRIDEKNVNNKLKQKNYD